jgi:hypothetical protein
MCRGSAPSRGPGGEDPGHDGHRLSLAWDEATLGVGDCSWRFKHVLEQSFC